MYQEMTVYRFFFILIAVSCHGKSPPSYQKFAATGNRNCVQNQTKINHHSKYPQWIKQLKTIKHYSGLFN